MERILQSTFSSITKRSREASTYRKILLSGLTDSQMVATVRDIEISKQAYPLAKNSRKLLS
jgi:hypothetical protein